MNEIFFLLFAFFTVFLSIKLSYYADQFCNNSGVSKLFIGGVLVAGITSLPEVVTCFSAVFLGNNSLAIGDILGSNIFNIFMICFFDIIFLKKFLFLNVSKTNNIVFILLIFNYLILYLFVTKTIIYFYFIPSLAIIFSYLFYLFRTSASKDDVVVNDFDSSAYFAKLIICSLLMIFCSIVLTIIVNNIANLHPSFSSSFLGAIFLGITTSLPEVVTCYALISIDSYDLALSDIIGSNFFNLLVIAVANLLVKNSFVYDNISFDIILMILLGLIFTILCFFISNYKGRYSQKFYGLFSFLIVIVYLSFWIINFLY